MGEGKRQLGPTPTLLLSSKPSSTLWGVGALSQQQGSRPPSSLFKEGEVTQTPLPTSLYLLWSVSLMNSPWRRVTHWKFIHFCPENAGGGESGQRRGKSLYLLGVVGAVHWSWPLRGTLPGSATCFQLLRPVCPPLPSPQDPSPLVS